MTKRDLHTLLNRHGDAARADLAARIVAAAEALPTAYCNFEAGRMRAVGRAAVLAAIKREAEKR